MLMKRLLICTVLFCFTSFKIQGNFFVAKKCDNYWCTKGNYICITNTSFALSWNDPEVKESLQQVSNFTPKPKQNDFDCEIKDDYRTQQYFKKDNWDLITSFNELVLDERWEEMETIKTKVISGDKKQLIFEHVLEINAKYFDISFSIRTEKEAHIFLCDGGDISKSSCYWLLLQAFSGEASSIRKCPKGLIPVINNEWPKAPCKDRLVNVSHPQVPNFLSNQTWNHFVLSKRNETLRFTEASNRQTNPILNLRDLQEPINVKHMIVHSKMVNALWKIHKLEYIYTTVVSSWTIGPAIDVQEGLICISMYISMCSTCRLKLGLRSDGNIIAEETYNSEHAGWFKIRFVKDNLQQLNGQEVELVVSTSNSNQYSLWRLDNIRLCKKEEFRMIGLSEKASCQLMSNKDDIIEFNKETQVSILENHCPEDTIGSFCMRCNLTFEDCEYITICTKYECTCSAGYHGKNCYYKCGAGYYGHDCRKQCEKCYYPCNNIDGTCTSCTEGYKGSKCDIPPTVIFAHPPEIIEVGYTTATVQISNFQTENEREDDRPQRYTIHYKRDDGTSNWIRSNVTLKFKEPTNYEIKNLLPNSKYFVKAVIYSEWLQQWQDGYHLKFRMFTTKCEDISQENIQAITTNTSVFIYLIGLKDITCKYYSISLYQIPNNMEYSNQSGTYFTNLEPFMEYTAIFKENYARIEKKFMTTEGVPTPIRDLKATSSSTTIKLEWTQPENIYGIFKSYVVKYKHAAYMGCNKELPGPSNAPEKEKEVTDASVTLQNLIPYSVYTVTVYATNSKFHGVAESLTVSTDPEDEIGSEETPTIFNITESHNGANIELSKTNCEKFRGPLIMKVSSICTNSWCAEQTRKPKKLQQTLPVGLVTLKDLTPFSDYTVQFKYCRFNGSCTEPEKRTFKTKPSVPGKVKDLLIYTKNTTSILLRWEPPYPPTGILNSYKIEYYYYNRKYKQEELFNITHCKLWPKLHCATLSGLKSEKYYTITITAQNEEPDGFGDPETDGTTTRIEPSKAPYDLYAQWSSRNELNLEWKHPNQTNGDIQYFAILINGPNHKKQNIEKQFPVSEDAYNLTYYYQINSTDISPTTPYTINIYAYNGQNGYTAFIPTQSPPDLPTLTAEPEFDSSNEYITTTLMVNQLRGYSNNFRLLVLKTDQKNNLESYPELVEYGLKNLRVVIVCNINTVKKPYTLNIGQDQDSPNLSCEDKDNSPLNPATPYNITVVLVNTYNSLTRSNIYTYSYNTTGEPFPSDINSSLFSLLVLLLIIPLIAILYIKRSALKSKIKKTENSAKQGQGQSSTQSEEEIQLRDTKQFISKTETFSKQISSKTFENYVKVAIKKQELQQQHKTILETISTYETVRDSFRVEYVDMNYLSGLKVKNAFVVTKIPNSKEINEFWAIVWKDNIQHIILLEDIHVIKNKFIKYWPEPNDKFDTDQVTVELSNCETFENYVCRTFSMNSKKETRQITQLHFSLFSNEDTCLLSSLTYSTFFRKVSDIPLCSKSPILIHSSSGMHGTGFTLLCDMSLRTVKKDGAVDVMANLKKITEATPEMMIDYDHYELSHCIIADVINHVDTAVTCNTFETGKKLFTTEELQKHLEYLKNTSWLDFNNKQTRDSNVYFKVVAPEHEGQVLLEPYCIDDDTYFRSEHFKTTRVDGYRCPRKFLVTQQPTSRYLKEFFTLIREKKISLIVSLNENLTSWPNEMYPLINLGELTIKHKETKNLQHYDWITVELCGETISKTIEILSFKNWSSSEIFLPDVTHFVKFFIESSEMVQKTDSVLITCHDGITASGLYLTMFHTIQKIKAEGICDVCTSIRTVRRFFEYFIMGNKYYMFLVDASHAYFREFSLYEVR